MVRELEEDSEEGCRKCQAETKAFYVIAPIVLLSVVLSMLYMTRHSPLKDGPIQVELQGTLGQVFMFLQVVNVCLAADLKYGDPMTPFMEFISQPFDVAFITESIPCVQSGLATPVRQYATHMFAPVIFITILILAYFCGQCIRAGFFSGNGLLNTIGEVLVEFYISVTMAVFAPFNCYEHPNGKLSVKSFPSVLCESGNADHSTLLGISVFAILAYPVSVVVMTMFACWIYPTRLMKNDIGMLVRCHFLFNRWKPSCYWFSIIAVLRNFILAVLPMVMPDTVLDLTVFFMAATLQVAIGFVIWWRPRRTPGMNRLDGLLSIVQITILATGSFSVYGTEVNKELSTLLVLLCCTGLVTGFMMVGFKSIEWMFFRKRFDIVLSHHNGHGGISARVLHIIFGKMLTMRRGQRCGFTFKRVFFDVENIGFYGLIFDAVKLSKNMVIFLSSETLCRPWCVGAVVAAHNAHVPMIPVILEEGAISSALAGTSDMTDAKTGKSQYFTEALSKKKTVTNVATGSASTNPLKTSGTTDFNAAATDGSKRGVSQWAADISGTVTQMSKQASIVPTHNFEIDSAPLRPHGVAHGDIFPAVENLLSQEPIMFDMTTWAGFEEFLNTLTSKLTGLNYRGGQSIADLNKDICTEIYAGRNKEGKDRLLLMSDHSDAEAVSVSRLFAWIIRPNLDKDMKVIQSGSMGALESMTAAISMTGGNNSNGGRGSMRGSFVSNVVLCEDLDVSAEEFAGMAKDQSASMLIFLFTSGTTTSAMQLLRLAVFWTYHNELQAIPVVIGESFKFPSDKQLDDMATGKGLNLGRNPGPKMKELAGEEVEMESVKLAFQRTLEYFVTFMNVPGMNETEVEVAVRRVIRRAATSMIPETELEEYEVEEIKLSHCTHRTSERMSKAGSASSAVPLASIAGGEKEEENEASFQVVGSSAKGLAPEEDMQVGSDEIMIVDEGSAAKVSVLKVARPALDLKTGSGSED
jgi:hypothetical protein